jgi:hypothetical protein
MENCDYVKSQTYEYVRKISQQSHITYEDVLG